MHHYTAFGLAIASEIELTDLPAGPPGPGATVRLGAIPPRPDAQEMDDRRRVAVDPGAVTLFWDGFGAVRIAGGNEIVVDRAPGVDDGFYRQVVQNLAMGIALHQRGALTLHGSAVALPDGVVGFVGAKGAGKSTTTSALLARGHRLMTDDLMVVDTDTMTVLPGISSLKLWPESVRAAFGEDPEALPALFETTDKRLRDAGDSFEAAPRPLRRIYLLEYGGDTPQISPMPPREALITLVSQSYALRFIGNRGVSATHLAQCQRLAGAGVVARLTRPKNLDLLGALAEAIEHDLAG